MVALGRVHTQVNVRREVRRKARLYRLARRGLLLFVFYMGVPKIDLFVVTGSAAIRPEDVVWSIAMLFVVFPAMKDYSLPLVPRPVDAYFPYLMVSLISTILAVYGGQIDSIFYFARLLQYSSWGYLGLVAAYGLRVSDVRRMMLALSRVLAAWGLLEFVGLIPSVGRFGEGLQRLSINTSGPFEASVIVLLLMFLVTKRVDRVLLGVVLLLTQARSTLAGGMMALALARNRTTKTVLVVQVLLAGLMALAVFGDLVDQRVSETPSISKMGSLLEDQWELAPRTDSRTEYMNETAFREDGLNSRLDLNSPYLSFEIRAARWSTIIKSVTVSPIDFLFGWGPGAYGLAVDSGYVRVFGEGGVLGLGAFGLFLFRLLKRGDRSTFTFAAVICIATVGCLIDIFYASKVMPFFWFVCTFEAALSASVRPGRTLRW